MATAADTAAGRGDQRPRNAQKRVSPQLVGAGEGRRVEGERTNVSRTGKGALSVSCRLARRE